MLPPIALSLSCVVAVPALQSNTAIVPPAYAKALGNQVFSTPGIGQFALPAHEQVAYSVRQFPRAMMVMTGIAFRREHTLLVNNPKTRISLTLELSTSLKTPSQMLTLFAANHGKDRRVVFSGKVDFQAAPPGKWGPFTFARIPFKASFLLLTKLGKSVVLDFQVTANDKGSWLTDGVRGSQVGVGGVPVVNHTGFYCRDGSGRYVSQVGQDPDQLVIGGAYGPVYYPVPPNTIGIASVGLVGVGGFWGGARLPIALAGAPGCNWAIAPLMAWAFITDAKGYGRVPPLLVPHDRKLVGQRFYDQPAFVDAKANKLGLITSWSYRWTIGRAEHVAWLFRHRDTTPPSKMGTRLLRGWAPIVQFAY